MSKNRIAAPLVVVALGAGFGAALLGIAPVAQAQTSTSWEIATRIEAARGRINRNLESGSLSRGDARRLREQLDGIRDTEARMRRDGRLDHREREILDAKLDRLNREISAEKRR
jgi:hypothetical protein